MVKTLIDFLVKVKILKVESKYEGTGDRDRSIKRMPNIKVPDAEFKASRLLDWRYYIRTDMYTLFGKRVFQKHWSKTEYIDWTVDIKAELNAIFLSFGIGERYSVNRSCSNFVVPAEPITLSIDSGPIKKPHHSTFYTVPFDKYVYRCPQHGNRQLRSEDYGKPIEELLMEVIELCVTKLKINLEEEVVKINEEVTGVPRMGIPRLSDGSELCPNLVCRKHRVPVFYTRGNNFSICPVCGKIGNSDLEYVNVGEEGLLKPGVKELIYKCIREFDNR